MMPETQHPRAWLAAATPSLAVLFVLLCTLPGCNRTGREGFSWVDEVRTVVGREGGSTARPLITSSEDIPPGVPLLDGWEPEEPKDLLAQPRTADAGFRLSPGVYEATLESYCLGIGSFARSGGRGYVPVPIRGPRSAVIRAILRRASAHPEVPRADIQRVLWAILAQVEFDSWGAEEQATALRLLTDAELQDLGSGIRDEVTNRFLDAARERLPRPLFRILEAEREIRGIFRQAEHSYAQLQRVAVLAGDPPLDPEDRPIPEERWSHHPDGYFIRYRPHGFSSTTVQIAVPRRWQVERDELGRIVAIHDDTGHRTETDYDDDAGTLEVPGERDLRGYAFRRIRFIRPTPGQPTRRDTVELEDIGWTYVNMYQQPLGEAGAPAAAPRSPLQRSSGLGPRPAVWLVGLAPARPQEPTFPRWRERYERAMEVKERTEHYLEQVNERREYYSERWDRATAEPTAEDARRIQDIEHYQDGLMAALRGTPSERYEWLIDHHERQAGALRWATHVLEGLPEGPGGGETEVHIDDRSAVPASAASQRLGISVRPSR